MVPHYEELASFFQAIEGLYWEFQVDEMMYRRDPKAFDINRYIESGDLGSYFDNIELEASGIAYVADDVWDVSADGR